MWSPRLVESVRPQLKRGVYQPRPLNRTVVVFEANDHLNRNMVIPSTIIELAYRYVQKSKLPQSALRRSCDLEKGIESVD